MSARADVRKLRAALPRPRGEIWWQISADFPDGDGLCRPSGMDDGPALTETEFDALPDDRDRVLIQVVPAPDPEPGEAP